VRDSVAADKNCETDLPYRQKVAIPGNMGFAARFLDTEKNIMGVWSMH
jgi:hypothetical protein